MSISDMLNGRTRQRASINTPAMAINYARSRTTPHRFAIVLAVVVLSATLGVGPSAATSVGDAGTLARSAATSTFAEPGSVNRAAMRATWVEKFGKKFAKKVNDRRWKWIAKRAMEVRALRKLRASGHRLRLQECVMYIDLPTEGWCRFVRAGGSDPAGNHYSFSVRRTPEGRVVLDYDSMEE